MYVKTYSFILFCFVLEGGKGKKQTLRPQRGAKSGRSGRWIRRKKTRREIKRKGRRMGEKGT